MPVVIHYRLTNIRSCAFTIQVIANLIGAVECRATQTVDVSDGVITHVYADVPGFV